MDNYYVHLEYRPSWLFSDSMSAKSIMETKKAAMAEATNDKKQLHVPKQTTMKKGKMPKKAATKRKKENREGEMNKKTKVKKEEREEGIVQGWMCKKNDGKGWHCNRPVSHPNSLCEHHFKKKRRNLNPKFASVIKEEKVTLVASAVASRPSSSSKTQKRKPTNNFSATEGFYYYTGFGSFRSKRHCRSTSNNSTPLPAPKQEEGGEPPKGASLFSPTKVDADNGSNNGDVTHDDVASY